MAIPDISDGPLQLARRRLDDAAHSLVDPVVEWSGGAARWSDPLYTRLRGALTARALGRRMVAGSRPPLRVDVLGWLVEVDAAVRAWEPASKGDTVDRLHTLTGRGWRPQDCELLDGYTAQIERWVIAASELLGDRAIAIALRLPCPSCGAGVVHRGAEALRGWALKLSEDGCSCSSCQAFWEPSQFEFLAKLLGCEALPS